MLETWSQYFILRREGRYDQHNRATYTSIDLNVQLLGKPPYEKYKNFSLATITTKMIRSMKGDFNPATVEIYQKHVALLVSTISITGCETNVINPPLRMRRAGYGSR